MKMDFFGSRAKKQKEEAAKPTQATPQKKEIKVDDSRRPRIVQPVTVSNRQPGTERLKSQSAIPSSQPVAGFKRETTSQEATVLSAKENAATGEVKPSPENTKAMIEAAPSPPAPAPAVSGGAPKEQKGIAGEFSDLFARNTVEVTENNRLAEGMKEIDARDLLTEGLGLVARLKRPGK